MTAFQSAYRKHHSTESALLNIHNGILLNMAKGSVTALTLLDLSAAFHTIDYTIILDRLNVHYGISELALGWFKSYLSGRTHSVKVFVYWVFYVAFNTVQVISRRVVGRAEETSTYSSLGFCTVNCRPTPKQLPALPLAAMTGIEPRLQRWEARVLPLCHRGPPTLSQGR